MAFANAQQSRALLGLLNLSGYVRAVNIAHTIDMLDVTTLADTAKAMIPGQDSSAMTADMIFNVDSTAGAQFDALDGMKATGPFPYTYCPYGLTAGSLALMANVLEASLTGTASSTSTVDVSMAGTADGPFDAGVVVEPPTAVTIDGNGTARDGGAASSNGGVAHLHVTAFSGLTNNIVTIEHSVDGSTSWATLVTFATYTGTTSERVVVAAGTTVRRYLRVVDNVTGTGSTTRAVTFARR